jgi:hypothetical protein
MMKAIKIDVEKKEVTHVEIAYGLEPIYEQLKCTTMTCPIIYPNGDALCVDEEGLLKPIENITGGFFLKNFPHQGFFGNGLLIGIENEDGSTRDASTDIIKATRNIVFMSHDEVNNEFKRLNSVTPRFAVWPQERS